MSAHAQTYTTNEALAIAHKLQSLKILSAKGEQVLLDRIRNTGKESETEQGLSRQLQSGWRQEELSNTSILIFLQEAFGRDFQYRSGTAELAAATQAINEKYTNVPIIPLNLLAKQATSDSILRQMQESFTGPKLEAAVPAEDFPLLNQGFTTYGPFGTTDENTYGWIDDSRSAMGKTRSRTLLDLQIAGLVEPAVVEEILPAIKTNTLRWEMNVLEKAAALQGFRDDYEENKAAEGATAQRLVAAGVMTASKYAKLIASYKPYELRGKRGLLPFCERTLIFQTADLPEAVQPFFETVFAQVQAQLLPNFKYRNLQATIDADTSEPPIFGADMVKRSCNLQFEVDSTPFRSTVFYDYLGAPQRHSHRQPVNRDLTTAINKWMAQEGVPHRLYFANYPDRSNVHEGREQFALLVLTQAQFKAWQINSDDHFIFEEVYNPAFTSENIDNCVGLCFIMDLFAHLNDGEKRAGMTRTRTTVINSYAELLSCFPKTVAVLNQDTGSLEDRYKLYVEELAAVSRGAFRPTNIKAAPVKAANGPHKTALSFDFAGTHYAADVATEKADVAPGFRKLLHEALAEKKIDGRWYPCQDNGQERSFIFLTAQQYQSLKEQQPALFSEN